MARKTGNTKAKKLKCLTCQRNAASRGLCMACYVAARREILAGRTTDRELVAAGLMLPNLRGSTQSPFRRKLQRLKSQQTLAP